MKPLGYCLASFFSLSLTSLLSATTYQAILLGPPNVPSIASAVGGDQQGGSVNSIPTLWTGAPDSAISLTTGALGNVLAVDGTHQAGYFLDPSNLPHATLWAGSASSLLDLNPQGFSQSTVTSILGDTQAGSGLSTATGQTHALLWHGSPDSATDLNPPGYSSSKITGLSADYLVGIGTPTSAGVAHALLWNRSTGQITDLGTAGYNRASTLSIAGNQIAGTARDFAGDSRPLLWNNLGTDFTNLYAPPTSDPEGILATNGTTQVGYSVGDFDHAVAWTGTHDSLVNLETFLPPNTIQSIANAIDPDGRIAGYYEAPTGQDHAFLLIPSTLLPEPTALLPLLLLTPLHARRSARRRQPRPPHFEF